MAGFYEGTGFNGISVGVMLIYCHSKTTHALLRILTVSHTMETLQTPSAMSSLGHAGSLKSPGKPANKKSSLHTCKPLASLPKPKLQKGFHTANTANATAPLEPASGRAGVEVSRGLQS